MDQEWACAADDVLWRRSKLGLRLSPEQAAALGAYMSARLDAGMAGRAHSSAAI
jgi:glycerol-3-phosphate dehydrogenase